MTDETPIDAAFRLKEAAPEDVAARMRFFERVLDAELHVLLAEEPATDGAFAPSVFDVEEGRFVLAFDRGERLAAFLEEPAPYAALAGRRLVAMLAGRGLGLGLNLGEAPSASLLPPEAVDWMAAIAATPREVAEARVRRVSAPRGVSAALIGALDAKLGAMAGVIGAAHLVSADFEGEAAALLLALVDVPEAARDGVAEAIAETARVSGDAGAALDVTFLPAGAPALAAITAQGLTFEMPAPVPVEVSEQAAPRGPGMDPARPPILRR